MDAESLKRDLEDLRKEFNNEISKKGWEDFDNIKSEIYRVIEKFKTKMVQDLKEMKLTEHNVARAAMEFLEGNQIEKEIDDFNERLVYDLISGFVNENIRQNGKNRDVLNQETSRLKHIEEGPSKNEEEKKSQENIEEGFSKNSKEKKLNVEHLSKSNPELNKGIYHFQQLMNGLFDNVKAKILRSDTLNSDKEKEKYIEELNYRFSKNRENTSKDYIGVMYSFINRLYRDFKTLDLKYDDKISEKLSQLELDKMFSNSKEPKSSGALSVDEIV